MEFLKAFEILWTMFADPFVFIPLICVGIILYITLTYGNKKDAERRSKRSKIKDPLDWIDK